jgi:hypothetical protein
MECQARNSRRPATLALSSSGRLTEGASLLDALRTELATAPRPPTGAPIRKPPSMEATINNNSNSSNNTTHARPPVIGVNDGAPTARYTQNSLPWSGFEKADIIPW